MRAVVDTNVLLPAIWREEGSPGPVLDSWHAGEFDLVTSNSILDEVEAVLSYPRIARRRGWSTERVAVFMRTLRDDSSVVEPAIRVDVVRDHSDNRFIEAAVSGEVDYIVTVDNDLLSLEEYEGIRIVTPARFLAILREAQ